MGIERLCFPQAPRLHFEQVMTTGSFVKDLSVRTVVTRLKTAWVALITEGGQASKVKVRTGLAF